VELGVRCARTGANWTLAMISSDRHIGQNGGLDMSDPS
jgi:hypothetical protein